MITDRLMLRLRKMQTAHNMGRKEFRSLLDAIEHEVDETAKAYGGCTNCYGKGYATVIDFMRGVDTDTDIGGTGESVHYRNSPMRYCTCPRGVQLQELTEAKK